jgi:hypothetical protein
MIKVQRLHLAHLWVCRWRFGAPIFFTDDRTWRQNAPSMNTLSIELDRVWIRPELLAPLRAELEAAGLNHGCLALGEVPGESAMIYLLWHASGEAPVSIMTQREDLCGDYGAREVAQRFVEKWKLRS